MNSSANPPGKEKRASNQRDSLRSLTRLMIGGAEMSAGELLDRLQNWEREAAQRLADAQTGEGSSQANENQTSLARYALIGLIFEMQESLSHSFSLLGHLDRYISGLLAPWLRPFQSSALFAPSRRRYQRLIARGEMEVARWVRVGRHEQARSQAVAAEAFDDVVDAFIEYLASNPELQDLVQAQSTGLANEVVEEVRERTVSADTFLEGLARSLLRRMPRSQMPEPPLASHLRQSGGAPRKSTHD
ncbi:MAG: hypothetical protein L0Z70_10795 [Chloroflexi bacterium]|nr:hypothetical protein [Chloroflexota bacterium]